MSIPVGMLALLAFFLGSAPVWAESPSFTSFTFDGASFRESRGPGAIWVRDGMLPTSADEVGVREDPLPEGTGAVALLCYRQSSGGKLRGHAGVAPMAGVAVSAHGAGFNLAARTDAGGYLILALPSGSYDFKLGNVSKHVEINSGKTSIVSIRGGKRMVD